MTVQRFIYKTLITLLLVSSTSLFAKELNQASFSTIDSDSVTIAKQLLAMGQPKAVPLALSSIEDNSKAQQFWQLFSLNYLSNHPLDESTMDTVKNSSLFERLDDYDTRKEFAEELSSDEQLEHGKSLCPLILQQPYNDKIQYPQNSLLRYTQSICLTLIESEISKPAISKTLIDMIEEPNSSIADEILEKFSENENLDISDQDKNRLTKALVAYFIGLTEQEEESGSSYGLSSYDVGKFIRKQSDSSLQSAFMDELNKQLDNPTKLDQQQWKHVLKGLLEISTEETSQLFWKLSMQEKNNLVDLEAILEGEYNNEHNDEMFPEELHNAAINKIKAEKDLHFAATYMYLINDAEGGSDWSNGISVANTVHEMSESISKDKDTQSLLKYVYLQAAGMVYFEDVDNLEIMLNYLDNAKKIPHPVLSLYEQQTKGEEERSDQHEDFSGVSTLYEKGQLKAVVQSVIHDENPEAPFTKLPLRAYELFSSDSSTEIQYRIWHDNKTGEAILVDNDGKLFFFDGYELGDNKSRFSAHKLAHDSSADMPSLTAPLASWAEYLFSKVDESTNKSSDKTIKTFTETKRKLDERLLFAKLESNEIPNYPDYMEYKKYGSDILINLDVDGSIQQLWLTAKQPQDAKQLFSQIKATAPQGTQSIDTWYKPKSGLIIRQYEHPQEGEVQLTPEFNKDAFNYPDDCEVVVDKDSLKKKSNGFSDREYDLYTQGYYMTSIMHSSDCLSESDKKAHEEDMEKEESSE